MTKAELNQVIRNTAARYGFETREGFYGIEEMISEELNFTVTTAYTEGTDWKAGKEVEKVVVSASVRKMGGNPTPEELLKTADEISRGAELVRELQSMCLIFTEQH